MKLQEYFNQQKDQGLSDIQKMDIYHAVMEKNMKKSFQRKRSLLHIKTFVYTSFLFFFLVGFYGMYFFQTPNNGDEEYMLSNLSQTNVAQADLIAKIVDFDGSFFIEQDGQTIQTSNIKNGDIVTLRNDAQIVFHIDDETKAKIIGPAKFVINKKSQGQYKIVLLYGEYVEMTSLQKENKYNIELSVDDLTVSQGENKDPIDFQLLKQGNSHVIKNNGAKLIVSSDNKKSTTNLGNNQVLAIQGNDISLFDSFEKFAKAVKEKNLSQTFTFTETTIQDPIVLETTGDNTIETIKTLDEDEILGVQEQDIPEDISVPFDETNGQSIATPDQTKTIDIQLNKEFVEENISELIAGYMDGNVNNFERSFNSLENRISAIAKGFQYKYISLDGSEQEKIVAMIGEIQKLSKHISDNYFLPPKYIENLNSIVPKLSTLKNIDFEENITTEE